MIPERGYASSPGASCANIGQRESKETMAIAWMRFSAQSHVAAAK
jgi:hypothetical protein